MKFGVFTMLTPKSPQQYEFGTVYINELVLEDHSVRLIDMAIDFKFIRDEVAHLYCENNGRPSIDPVRFLKILFLRHLFGISSERPLIKEIQVKTFLANGCSLFIVQAMLISMFQSSTAESH